MSCARRSLQVVVFIRNRCVAPGRVLLWQQYHFNISHLNIALYITACTLDKLLSIKLYITIGRFICINSKEYLKCCKYKDHEEIRVVYDVQIIRIANFFKSSHLSLLLQLIYFVVYFVRMKVKSIFKYFYRFVD